MEYKTLRSQALHKELDIETGPQGHFVAYGLCLSQHIRITHSRPKPVQLRPNTFAIAFAVSLDPALKPHKQRLSTHRNEARRAHARYAEMPAAVS